MKPEKTQRPGGLKNLAFVVILCLALSACRDSKVGADIGPLVVTSPPAPATLYLTNAQPRLPTIKLFLGPEELTTEVALKPYQLATGMMYRTNMSENEAMLFVFGQPHRTSFYMRNTVVPLSAAYIDPEGTILEIHDLKPLEEQPVEASNDNIQYVLEVPQGWFKRHNVSTGAVIRSQIGSLRQTFTISR